MNLTKALKSKKKLITNANKIFSRVRENNINEKDVKPHYDSKEQLEKYKAEMDAIIQLKTKIHLANAPIYDKIFRLSELKSLVQNLKYLNVKDNKVVNRDGNVTDYFATINTLERDELVEQYEAEIESLQDEIEEFNAKTKI